MSITETLQDLHDHYVVAVNHAIEPDDTRSPTLPPSSTSPPSTSCASASPPERAAHVVRRQHHAVAERLCVPQDQRRSHPSGNNGDRGPARRGR